MRHPAFWRFWLCMMLLCSPVGLRAENFTIFAAASLKTALDQIASDFTALTGHSALISYAGTPVLARQIEFGAPADIFIPANPVWMDALAARGLIDAASRFDLISNQLVLVSHDPAAPRFDLSDPTAWQQRLDGTRLAMALVDAVPAGVYGKAALQGVGVWDALAPDVVQSDNVRSALALVSRGEAAYGIVYNSDAVAEPRVFVIGTFAPEHHPPIRYPVALVAASQNAAARAFVDYLARPVARKVLLDQGFKAIAE